MVSGLVSSLALVAAFQQVDTTTFADSAAAELYFRARARHIRQDSLVRDYQALVRTRIDASVGKSRFSRQTTLIAHEAVSQVIWRAPNDLKITALGARTAAPILRMAAAFSDEARDEMEAELSNEEIAPEIWLDRPWFIPRALGDSIRIMGVPEQAALHPLGRGSQDVYRYAITDSVTISVPGRQVRAVKVRVEPKELGPSLVAGDMWIDRESADVVRLVVVFVGQYLWDRPTEGTPEDSAETRQDNVWANRFLSVEADVEYALIESRYWLPYRQFLAITAEIPWFISAAMPVRAVSTFEDYRVNTSPELVFQIPMEEPDSAGKPGFAVTGEERRTKLRVKNVDDDDDNDWRTSDERRRNGYARAGTWSNGRWEVDVPPADSLLAYEWESDLKISFDADEERRFRESLAWLAEISEELPPQWVGRRRFQAAWEQFSDIIRYNRVQGISLGAGVLLRPRIKYTTVQVTGRFAFGDLRPDASVLIRREAPQGRWDLRGYYRVFEVESWTHGLGVGNSINAFFTGHDYADYYRAWGGGTSYRPHSGVFRDLELGAYFEHHQSLQTEVSAAVPSIFGDGTFPPNPPVRDGDYLRGSLAHVARIGLLDIRTGAEGLWADSVIGGRLFGSVVAPFRILRRTGTLTLRGGIMRGDSLPQLDFRVGGQQTVRGYTYGAKSGREFWSAQLDYALRRSVTWTPVIFFDVGDTFAGDPLFGAGLGVSFLNGFFRAELSKGFNPSTDVRFDLVFRAPR